MNRALANLATVKLFLDDDNPVRFFFGFSFLATRSNQWLTLALEVAYHSRVTAADIFGKFPYSLLTVSLRKCHQVVFVKLRRSIRTEIMFLVLNVIFKLAKLILDSCFGNSVVTVHKI